jgi:hypothetical protein
MKNSELAKFNSSFRKWVSFEVNPFLFIFIVLLKTLRPKSSTTIRKLKLSLIDLTESKATFNLYLHSYRRVDIQYTINTKI